MAKKDIKKNNAEVTEAAEEVKADDAVAEESTAVAENTPAGEEKKTSVKPIIVRCIAAVLCTAIVAFTVNSGVSKYAEAIKPVEGSAEAGENTAGDDIGSDVSGGDVADVPTSGDVDTPVDNGDATGDTADTNDTPAADQGNTQTGNDAPAADAGNKTDSKPTASGKMDTAQIVALFNNAANGAKANAKSIHQNYTKNTQVTSIELKNKTLASLADKLIKANMGEDAAKHNKTYTGADKNAFPVEGQSWSSKLTTADIKEATVSDNNGTYSVVIKLKDDPQPNLKVGEGHAGKAFSLVTKEQIVEGAGSAGMAFIKEESIKVSHSGCVIKATIDKNTGKLKTANYYRVWKLELTALGIDVGISFGIEEDYVINW